MSRNTSVIFARSSDPQRGVTERTLLIGFCVAVGLILLVTGMVLLNQAIWSNRVDAKIAKLAAAGQPVSIGDIKRRHQEGMPRVNAADIYEKAFAAMQAMTGFNKDLLPLVGHAALPEDGDPLPAEMAEEIGRFLEAHAEAVAYFLARSQIVECRFSPTFTPEGDVGVEYVVRIRAGARLLALETMLAVHERRPTDAATAVIAIFRISDLFGTIPFWSPRLPGLLSPGSASPTFHRCSTVRDFQRKRFFQFRQLLPPRRTNFFLPQLCQPKSPGVLIIR